MYIDRLLSASRHFPAVTVRTMKNAFAP
jgi:hypothetical protein